ncbi:hypothetical protein N7456_005238, partial [Penicillium angulare]
KLNMADSTSFGYRWRSSKAFILFVIILALFCDTFLYSFPVPILSYMIEDRLGIDPSQTQNITAALLSLHGFITLVSAPITAHYADQYQSRKIPFLLGLVGCLVGTLLICLTPSLAGVFVGRILQAVSGSATWIVGSAALTDQVDVQNLGKLYGFAMSFVSAGVVAGPSIAGIVLELAGYWPAWSIPLGILTLDIIMRCLMIEKSKVSSVSISSEDAISSGETSALLNEDANSTNHLSPDKPDETGPDKTARRGFYQIMLSDGRVIVGLLNTILNATLLSSFDATLTLHLRDTFGWGSLAAGMMFLSLQLPFILLASAAGWIRDRSGLRYPTTIGWILLAPTMWLLGVPGTSKLHDITGGNGEGLYIFAVTAFGVISPFVRGAGYLQLSIVLNELQDNNPSMFGPQGGSNRVFALQDIALSLGLMIGPLISGLLSESVGYYWMGFTFGKHKPAHILINYLVFLILLSTAMICLSSAVTSWAFLSPVDFLKSDRHEPESGTNVA